jgi:Glyoxalase/Bleomycin resistance protein/Dioxygenase superfamily
MPEPVFTGVLQVCVVVRDLDEAMRVYWDGYGIGPWEVYEFNPQTVQNMTRDEQPSEHAMRLAVTMVGNLQWELIEPLDDNSIYADFLRDHGPGLQHVAMGVADYSQTIDLMHAKGHGVIQGGHYNGVSYAYLSTDRDLGFVSEIYDSIPQGQKPDRVYPPER